MNTSELSRLAIKAAKDCRRDADDASAATTIANAYSPVTHENHRLREAMCSVVDALDNGSRVVPDASLEFLCEVPGEVKLCVNRLRHDRDSATRMLIDKPKAGGPDVERLSKELAAARDELSKWRQGGLNEEILRREDGYVKVGNGCEVAIGGTSKQLGEWEELFPRGAHATKGEHLAMAARLGEAHAASENAVEQIRQLQDRNAQLIGALQKILGRASPMASELGDSVIVEIVNEALSPTK